MTTGGGAVSVGEWGLSGVRRPYVKPFLRRLYTSDTEGKAQYNITETTLPTTSIVHYGPS